MEGNCGKVKENTHTTTILRLNMSTVLFISFVLMFLDDNQQISHLLRQYVIILCVAFSFGTFRGKQCS